MGIYVNDLFSAGTTETANFTAYVNPYLVVSKGGQYTKHIYIGSQRIVSKLGDLDSYGQDPRRIEYAGANVDGAKVDYKAKYKESQQAIKDAYTHFEIEYLGKDNDDYVNGTGFCCTDKVTKAGAIGNGNDNPELFQYYYHPDHLGSTSYITNLDGEVVQHIEYVPFGEVFLEERNNKWNTPYLFNAKELDEETGLYYYGARYYDPRTSVWLGVDPLQEKYPNISTYTYCLLNPVKLIDPSGADPIIQNGVYFIEIAGAKIGVCISSGVSSFTSSAQERNQSGYIDYTINAQQYERDGTKWVAQGYSVLKQKYVAGRSSPLGFYASGKNGRLNFGQGDTPLESDFGVGGGIPVLINGLKYGDTNIYGEGAPQHLPTTGEVSDANKKYLVQKSSAGYSIQNNENMGKSILAYNSKTNRIMLIVQPHGKKGMTLDAIRNYLTELGYDNAISFDGSDSATLVQDNMVLVSPGFKKNQTIPSGIRASEKENK